MTVRPPSPPARQVRKPQEKLRGSPIPTHWDKAVGGRGDLEGRRSVTLQKQVPDKPHRVIGISEDEMTNSPISRTQKLNSHGRFWLKLLSRAGIPLAVILLGGIVAGAGWLWIFVSNQLAPLVSTELSKTLKRPVKVGRVERWGPTGLRFGPSEVPATPTDSDFALVPAVEVTFNPIQVLTQRTVSLNVTLVKADLYVEQDKKGNWIETQIQQEKSAGGPIQIQLDAIGFQEAKITAVANPNLRGEVLGLNKPALTKPFVLQQVNGNALFRDKQTRVEFDVAGLPATGGNLKVTGEAVLTPLKTNVQIQAQGLSGADVIPLIPNLPLDLQAGKIDCNLVMRLQETQLISWEGTAGFQGVAGKLAALDAPITQTNGRMRFKGLSVIFDDFTTLYGQIPAALSGSIDTAPPEQSSSSGFNLVIKLLPVSVENFTKTLAIASPVPVTGELAGNLKLTGQLEKPLLSGTVQNTKTIRVDKVDLALARATVQVDAAGGTVIFEEIEAKPVAGGQITGSGLVPLLPNEQLALDFRAVNLPGDAIAQAYSGQPPPIVIGAIAATVEVRGTPQSPNTLVQWQTPSSTYPGNGEIVVVGDTTIFRNTVFQVYGGTVTAKGTIVKNKWQASLNAEQVQLQQMGAPVPAELSTGELKASGTLDSFEPDNIVASGRGRVNIGGGQVNVTGNLKRGQWRVSVTSSEIQLKQQGSTAPAVLPPAELNISGIADAFAPDKITAIGQLQVAIAGNPITGSGSLTNGVYQATLNAKQVKLNQFAPSLPESVFLVDSQLTLAGNVNSSSASEINASAKVLLNVGSGSVNGGVTISKGQLQASLNATGVDVNQFATLPVPVLLADTQVNVSANLESGGTLSLQPAKIVADSQVRLSVGGEPVSGSATLRNGQFEVSLNAEKLRVTKFAPSLPQSLELGGSSVNVSGTLESFDVNGINADAQLKLNVAGGTVSGNATTRNGQFQGAIAASGVDVNQLQPSLPVPIKLADSKLNISGNLNSPENFVADSQVQLSVAGKPVSGNGAYSKGEFLASLILAGGTLSSSGTVRNGQLQTTITAENVLLNELAPNLPASIRIANGSVSLSGSLDSLTPEAIALDTQMQLSVSGNSLSASGTLDNGNFQIALNTVGGTISSSGTIRDGQLRTTILAREFDVNRLAPNLPLPVRIANGSANLSTNLNSPTPEAIALDTEMQLSISGNPASATATIKNGEFQTSLNIAGGTLDASGTVRNGQLQGILAAKGINFNQISPNLPLPVQLASGRANVAANLNSLTPGAIAADTQVQFSVAGDPVTGSGVFRNGQFEVTLNAQQLQVGKYAPGVSGGLEIAGGEANLSGNLDSFEPAGVNATAQLRLNVAGGTIRSSGTIRKGQLQASLTAKGVEVNQLNPGLPFPILLADSQVNISANLNSLTPEAIAADAQVELSVAGDIVNGSGTIRDGQFQVALKASELQVSKIAPNAPGSLGLSGEANLSGSFQSFVAGGIDAIAQLNLNIAGGSINSSATINKGQLQASLTATKIQVNQIAPDLPFPVQLANGSVTLSANLNSPTPRTLRADTQVQLYIAGDAVNGSGYFRNGEFEVALRAEQLQANKVVTDAPASLGLAGEASLSGNLDSFEPSGVNATARVRLDIASGSVSGRGTLRKGELQASFRAKQVQLNQLSANLPTAVELVDAQVNMSGTLVSFDPKYIDGSGEVLLSVAGGAVSGNGQLSKGEWQASVSADKVPLNPFAPNLPEPLQLADGKLQLSGTVDSFAPANIQADGDVEINSLSGTPTALGNLLPFTSSFRWNGESLEILEAIAPGLNASGLVFVGGTGTGRGDAAPTVTGFDLDVRLARINLANLAGQNPSAFVNASTGEPLPLIAGLVDFTGRVRGVETGSPRPASNLPFDIVVAGDMRLSDFAIASVAFEPLLAGEVDFNTGSGGKVEIKGERDAIALSSTPNLQSASFLISSEQILVTGGIENNIFSLQTKNFALENLNIAPAANQGLGAVGGLFSANAQFNLTTSQGFVDIQVIQPSIGYIGRSFDDKKGCNLLAPTETCNKFVGRASYENGAIALNNGQLKLGQGNYLVEARALLASDNPSFDGKITLDKGDVEGILQTLAWYTIEDVQRGILTRASAPSSTLEPIPVGEPRTAVQNQLRRFSEITALVQQLAAQRQTAAPPELVDVRGLVGGEITFAGSVQTGVKLGFNLEGENLEWRPQKPYQVVKGGQVVLRDNRVINIARFVLKGGVENQILTLLPLRIEINQGTATQTAAQSENSNPSPANAVLSFVGTIGGQSQSGQVRIENLNAETVRNFVDVPGIVVNGQLNAQANLAGSIDNPQSRGEVSFVNGTLNGDPIPSVAGGFSLANSRLNVSTVAPDTIQIIASVPVPVPGGSTPGAPGNDAIALDVNVKNEGLAILNILSRKQVEWVDGIGQVTLSAKGRLNPEQGMVEDLVATGSATAQNAIIKAEALPDPLRGVTGKIRFDRDRIIVEEVAGNFTKGKVVAKGILPIFASLSPDDPDVANPLTVNLEQAVLNLKGLYRGGVDGSVVITGTALAPQIGGEIQVAKGQVLLPSEETQAGAAGGGSGRRSAAATGDEPVPEFNNLQLTLGEDLQITSPPLLQFVATGNLTINGTLDFPLPDGVIELETGQVNLFTTRFNLARGYEQTAEFVGTADPILNVRLVASVPEVQGSQTATEDTSEINDTPRIFGSVRTVRVEARVSGPASEISQNLQLTSTPARDEGAIIALIGGGFINTLAQADSPVGIANLAGSALLGNVQYAIANALGLSEFRLSPALVKSGSESRVALEAEAGVDIGRNFSISVVRILLDNQNTKYNLRYRVNDEVLLRGSTDLEGDNQATVEYELRF